MENKHKEKSKLSDIAHDRIKEMILNNRFRAGEHLDEVDLCALLNVSRTPLREAINRLVYENLLISVPQKGIFVPELTVQSITELFQARKLIEPIVMMLSAPFLDISILESYKHISQKLLKDESPDNVDKLHEIDFEFHHYIASMCNNQYILDANTSIEEQFQRVRTQNFYPRERAINGAKEHIDIIDKILDKDYESLPDCLLNHIVSTEKYYYKNLIEFSAADVSVHFIKKHNLNNRTQNTEPLSSSPITFN